MSMTHYIARWSVALIDNPDDQLWFTMRGYTSPDPQIAKQQIQNIVDARNSNPLMEHEVTKLDRVILNVSNEEADKIERECREHNPGRTAQDLFPGEPARVLHFPVFEPSYTD